MPVEKGENRAYVKTFILGVKSALLLTREPEMPAASRFRAGPRNNKSYEPHPIFPCLNMNKDKWDSATLLYPGAGEAALLLRKSLNSTLSTAMGLERIVVNPLF
jgi:hypothetical protein